MVRKRWNFHQFIYHGVFDCVHQTDDVGPTSQVLQDLDLTLDLLFLNWLRCDMRWGLSHRKVLPHVTFDSGC